MTPARLLALLCLASPALAEPPGLVQTRLAGPNGPLEAAIWFPALPGGRAVTYGATPVFVGRPAREDAPVAPGPHPLVLVSHGLGGHARSLGWLAAGLAERGAVVVAVNHPGSTFGDMAMPRGLQHWTRVEDLSAAIDALLSDPRFGPAVDPGRIHVAGFSYGGWTALSAGGLQGDLDGYADHCAKAGDRSTHCADLARWGVDFGQIDPALWNASHRDPRVARVAAIDPGLTHGVTDVAGLAVPALLIGLGDGEDRLLATDTRDAGSGLGPRILAARPDARLVEVAPARHFTALPVCTPAGAAILQDEGDDPVCTDPPGTSRAAVHGRIVGEIAAFFGL